MGGDHWSGRWAQLGWTLLPHPPYSPDASPCDYGLFAPMKRPMKGKTFHSDEEVKEAVKESLKNIDVIHYDKWIKALPSRYEKIMMSHGDYFE
jgi:histone-lysine N-methyltransferase SETMAR